MGETRDDPTARAAHDDAPAFRRNGAGGLLGYLHAVAARRCAEAVHAPDPAQAARAALDDAAAALRGLERYQTHPFRRSLAEPEALWRAGAARLLDFGGGGRPALLIPSLINRWTILDLEPGRSPPRWLAQQGRRAFVMAWGAPGPQEAAFRLEDYLEARLIPAFDAALSAAGGPVDLIGYCMGGPLALALAQRRADAVGKVATLGAPWDFSVFPEHRAFRRNRAALESALEHMAAVFGAIPAQVAQTVFAMRDFEASARKFRRFARPGPDPARERRFVAIEDWLNDGPPLASGVARECFVDWIVDNALMKGRWRPGGRPFDPARNRHETLVVAARRDSVVRPASAEPLAEALPRARLLRPLAGHIGMIVGDDAVPRVWRPIRDFLEA